MLYTDLDMTALLKESWKLIEMPTGRSVFVARFVYDSQERKFLETPALLKRPIDH